LIAKMKQDIVEQLEVSKPAVSRALESLETKGYIARYKDASDRRASRVLLTPRAHKIRQEVESVYNQVCQVAAQGVSLEEARFFIDLLSRICENFSRARSEAERRREQE